LLGDEAAGQHYAEALRLYEQVGPDGRPFDRARTQLLLRWVAPAGTPPRRRSRAAGGAFETFQRLGAGPWADLRARQIAFTCPERRDQTARRRAKGPAGGRPPAFDPVIYRRRNVVERCFNRLKQFRGLATRYAKRLAYYRAEVVIAAIALWLRDSQDRP
jgi:transposase